MALRALFFIAAVALLAPHGSGVGNATGAIACDAGVCTADASMLGKVENEVIARLAEVKAEIAAAQAARTRQERRRARA
jgi:hypothetical protein